MGGAIKFRAWIPDIERMYSVNSFEMNPPDNAEPWLRVWEHPCERTAKIKMKIAKYRLADEIKLMQFTGLTDKNGKEIYEGDIVKGWKYGINDGGLGDRQINKVVEYNEGRAAFENCYDLRNGVEVIGNIYENPELLEDGVS